MVVSQQLMFYFGVVSFEAPFTSLESEYATAGWLGTFGVMNTVANSEEFQNHPFSGIPEDIFRMCHLIAEKSPALLDTILEWAGLGFHDHRRKWLERSGIIFSTQIIMPEFTDAYGAYSDQDFHEWLVKETNFERLLPIVEFYEQHFSQILASKNPSDVLLTDEISAVHRDIAFYVGKEDPAR